MQESYGTSPSGNLKEAVRGISNPAFLILMSNAEQFETHVAELEELYPGVPSIGCIGMSYQTSVTEKGVSVTAFEGVEAVTDVLEQFLPHRKMETFLHNRHRHQALVSPLFVLAEVYTFLSSTVP